jgi:aminomethyltransferase
MILPGTPFHPRTSVLCQPHNWRRWAKYVVAGSYELSPEREYWAIRNAAALLDVTPLYKYIFQGPDAARVLNRIVTRDVSKCAVGQVMYTPWCDEHGKVIDDGTIQRRGENLFFVTSADPNYRWFCENAMGFQVTIQDVSDTTAALSLQGPRSREILNLLVREKIDSLKYFHVMPNHLKEIPAMISRTGYTGDLGYEIWVEAKDAITLWDMLMEAGEGYGITPIGILALDLARVEAGLILIETDYTSVRKALIPDQMSSPYELGLGWTVALDKVDAATGAPQNFVGKRALVQEKKRGEQWKFVGIEIDWESLEEVYAHKKLHPQLPLTTWRASTPIYIENKQVGYASSGCWSPILKKYIALAHLRAPNFEVGTNLNMEVTVEHERKQALARVVKTPFYNPEHKRK